MQIIKTIREQSGFTQSDFAAYFDIPVGTVRNWEQGISKCPDYLLKLIIYRLRKEDRYY